MSYSTPSQVAALNKTLAKTIGVGPGATLDDIQTYIDMAEGEINAVLLNKGYEVPVDASSNPTAGALLLLASSRGAQALWEEASPVAPNLDRTKKAYDNALKLLSDAKFSVEAASDEPRAEVRAPWLTFTPPPDVYDPQLAAIEGVSGDGISACVTNSRRLPFFSRSQRF